MKANKRFTGEYFEGLACEYLKENGVRISERNFRCRNGEIDIIGTDDKYLVFFEVKYRTGTRYGTAEEAVDYSKQRVICRVSDFYRKKNKISECCPIRYDVIAVTVDETSAIHIRWHKNAYSYIPIKGYISLF